MKNNELLLRKAKLSDVSSLIDLEKQFVKEHNYFENPNYRISGFNDKKLTSLFSKKVSKRNKLFLVLDDCKNLQGFLFAEISKNKMDSLGYLHKQKPFLYLEGVFIKKAYRGQGYFSLFMDELYLFAKNKKINVVDLHVSFSNVLAKSIYEQLGFEPVVQKMRLKLNNKK